MNYEVLFRRQECQVRLGVIPTQAPGDDVVSFQVRQVATLPAARPLDERIVPDLELILAPVTFNH
jgi:hypothetical protein